MWNVDATNLCVILCDFEKNKYFAVSLIEKSFTFMMLLDPPKKFCRFNYPKSQPTIHTKNVGKKRWQSCPNWGVRGILANSKKTFYYNDVFSHSLSSLLERLVTLKITGNIVAFCNMAKTWLYVSHYKSKPGQYETILCW